MRQRLSQTAEGVNSAFSFLARWAILPIAFIFAMLFNGQQIENYFFPVYDNFQFELIEETEDQYIYNVYADKLRQCTPVPGTLNITARDENGFRHKLIREVIKRPGGESGAEREVGENYFGVWAITKEEFPLIDPALFIEHRCHAIWNSKKFYPIELV